MISKEQQIREALDEGNDHEALRIAASFHSLGEHKEAITRGWAACTRAEFYRQIGKDPEALIKIGVAAVRERYGYVA